MIRALIAILLIAIALPALAEEAQNHAMAPGHGDHHEKFYKHLMMPDNPSFSCCNRNDCGPTQYKYTSDGSVVVKFDGRWIAPPKNKVMTRVTPDGGGHLCAIKNFENKGNADNGATHVFCVILPPNLF